MKQKILICLILPLTYFGMMVFLTAAGPCGTSCTGSSPAGVCIIEEVTCDEAGGLKVKRKKCYEITPDGPSESGEGPCSNFT